MTLIEAVKAMGNGKIYRTDDPKTVWVLDRPSTTGLEFTLLSRLVGKGNPVPMALSKHEILAENWEILEEKK